MKSLQAFTHLLMKEFDKIFKEQFMGCVMTFYMYTANVDGHLKQNMNVTGWIANCLTNKLSCFRANYTPETSEIVFSSSSSAEGCALSCLPND